MSAHGSFGKYVLLRKLATGGMGEIFLAKQVGPSGFEKLLVIKRILSHHHDKNDYLSMFLSEAKLVARLTHNNVIQIHEMGQIDGDYFIAMEYVRGKSLRDIIDTLRSRGEQMPLAHVIDLAIKLCEGLGYAHGAQDLRGRPMNIIHRDVNPHNVLISYSGDLKLIDFGIAKSEMASVNTATGTIKGKFVYMSPEQSAADPIDFRSDIFSLGIVLYELATLENPFVRQNVVLSLEAIQRHDVDPPETKRDGAAALAPLLTKALSKDPETRYQSCYELRDELRGLFRNGEVKSEEQDIEHYLNNLFADDIEEEDLLLAEADSATSPPQPQTPSLTPSFVEARKGNDVTRSGRPPSHVPVPRPITSKPFSDDEETMSGDQEQFAARSRRQSEVSRQLRSEDELKSVSDRPNSESPQTRSERLPSDVLRWANEGFPSINSTADMPAEALLDSSLPPVTLDPFSDSQERAHDSGEWMPPREETREIRRGISPESSPFEQPSLFDTLGNSDRDNDMQREPSVSLPVYVGKGRRAMLFAAVVLFLVTVALGYWATLTIAKRDDTLSKREKVASPELAKPKLKLVPAPDPIFTQDEKVKQIPLAKPSTISPEPKIREPSKKIEKPSSSVERNSVLSKKPRRKKRRKVAKSSFRSKKPKIEGSQSDSTDSQAIERSLNKIRIQKNSLRSSGAPNQGPAEKAKITNTEKKAVEAKNKTLVSNDATSPSEGALSVRSSVGVQIYENGKPAKIRNGKISVDTKSGKLSLNSPNLPYEIELIYRVVSGGVSMQLNCTPWAIVKHNGISLGKTPQGPVAPGRRHRFSFLRPGQRKPVVVSVVWYPVVK